METTISGDSSESDPDEARDDGSACDLNRVDFSVGFCC